MRDRRWVEQAACGRPGLETRVFYSERWFPDAKRICSQCPVRTECLTDALKSETGELRYGVWGGLDPEERKSLVASGGNVYGAPAINYKLKCPDCGQEFNRTRDLNVHITMAHKELVG